MTKEDKVQVSVLLDGKQSINKLGQMEMKASEYRQELKKIKRGTEDWVATNAKLKKVQADISKTRSELGLTGMTLRQLRSYQRELNNEMTNGVTRGTARYKQLNKELKQVNAQINRQRQEMRGLNTAWARMQSSVKQFGVLALSYIGFTALTSQINNMIGRSAKLSDRLADVSKTTGLADEEVQELSETFKKMNTRTARSELLGMAKVAGKLGLTAKKDIEGFVAAADKINIALGEDLGDPEQNLRKLGKLLNVFKVTDDFGIEESLLKVGSAINHLGKSSEANEGFIVEFTNRLAGIAPLANISIQDVMGLAAASDALGQRSETSTTALSKLFLKMSQQRDVFARFSKDADGNTLSMKQFSDLIDNDANEAFLALLRGVKDNSNGMIELAETLDVLGVDGGRVVGVLGTLSNNIEFVQKQQKISNDEFERGTSVLNEFNLKNETFGAKLEKIQKAIYSKFVNSGVISFFENLVDKMSGLLPVATTTQEKLFSLSEAFERDMFALKNGNFSLQERQKLISEINNKYGEYLPNLITEKTTLKELQTLHESVNKQIMGKILLLDYEEEVSKVYKNQKDAAENLYQIEKKRQEINQLKFSGKGDAALIRHQEAQLKNMEDLNQMLLDNTDASVDEITEKYEGLSARMNIIFSDLLKGKKSSTRTTASSTSGSASLTSSQVSELQKLQAELKSIQDQILLDGLSADQREIAQTEAKYEKLQNQLNAFLNRKTVSEKDHQALTSQLQSFFDSEMDLYFQSRQEKEDKDRSAFKEALALEMMSEKDAELAMIQSHYDELKTKAEQYGIETEQIEEARQAAIQAVREKYRKIDIDRQRAHAIAIASMMTEIGGIMTSLNTLIGGQSEQMAVFQITMTQLSILINQAAALSEAIKGATQSAAATGPAAVFTIGPMITAMIGTVLAGFAQAKRVLSQAEEPKAPTFKNTVSRPSFFYGGDTNRSPGLGYGDGFGEFAGYTHFDEFVRPAYLKNDPQTQEAENVIKSRMAGQNVPESGSLGKSLDDQIALQLMASNDRLSDTIDVLVNRGIPSYFAPETYQKAKEYDDKINQLRADGI